MTWLILSIIIHLTTPLLARKDFFLVPIWNIERIWIPSSSEREIKHTFDPYLDNKNRWKKICRKIEEFVNGVEDLNNITTEDYRDRSKKYEKYKKYLIFQNKKILDREKSLSWWVLNWNIWENKWKWKKKYLLWYYLKRPTYTEQAIFLKTPKLSILDKSYLYNTSTSEKLKLQTIKWICINISKEDNPNFYRDKALNKESFTDYNYFPEVEEHGYILINDFDERYQSRLIRNILSMPNPEELNFYTWGSLVSDTPRGPDSYVFPKISEIRYHYILDKIFQH